MNENRLFNVKNDAVERQKIVNAVSRLRLMIKLGKFDDAVNAKGEKSDWSLRQANQMIARFEARLRELS